ncbi:MAG: hypothetical protein ACPGUH_02745 [Winogradskyella sp.]
MKRFLIIVCFVFISSCDDGDIITLSLDFDDTLERCDNFENHYLLYTTRTNPSEALILTLPKPTSDYLFTDATDTAIQLTIPNETQFYYRTYNNNLGNVLCNEVSDPDLVVLQNNEATSGTVKVDVSFIDDDNDGIPSINEDRNNNGDYEDDDFDSDGIPDYLDEDDDNDNVKTKFEDANTDGDNNPFTNPLNTDGDTLPNYLDDDDDGDNVLTRLEDSNENENPRDLADIVTDTNGNAIYRYLYNGTNAVEAFADSGFIDNTYTRVIYTKFTVINAGLEVINSTEIQLGTFEGVSTDFTTVNDD